MVQTHRGLYFLLDFSHSLTQYYVLLNENLKELI